MMRRLLRRLALAIGAALATRVAAELAARAFAVPLTQKLRAGRGDGGAAEVGVLCVGDSYTFGLYYRGEESWPGRLEQILRAGDAPGTPRVGVANAAVPAQN